MPPFVPSLQTQIACIKRELRLRNFKYPQWVAANRMSQKTADEEILTMEAVLQTLQNLRPANQAHQEDLPL